jgi:hypothetical protein
MSLHQIPGRSRLCVAPYRVDDLLLGNGAILLE